MLVLSRKKEEKIWIGPDITVTILRVKGHSVKIGIEAPSGMQILRGELNHSAGGQESAAERKSPPVRSASLEVSPTAQRRPVAAGPQPGGQEAASGGESEAGAESAHAETGQIQSERVAPRLRAALGDFAYRGAGRSLAACG